MLWDLTGLQRMRCGSGPTDASQEADRRPANVDGRAAHVMASNAERMAAASASRGP